MLSPRTPLLRQAQNMTTALGIVQNVSELMNHLQPLACTRQASQEKWCAYMRLKWIRLLLRPPRCKFLYLVYGCDMASDGLNRVLIIAQRCGFFFNRIDTPRYVKQHIQSQYWKAENIVYVYKSIQKPRLEQVSLCTTICQVYKRKG